MYHLFHLFNHNKLGKSSLEDVIGIMGHQIRALGHEAVWDPKNDAHEDGTYDIKFVMGDEGYNWIVEGFTDKVIEIIAQAHGNGAKFICLATEEPTPKGFNHGISREMALRQQSFPHAAKYFDGILHLVPGEAVTRWYGQFAPSFQADLGYAPSLIRQFPYNEPSYDFGFFGSLSPRRYTILKRLGRRTTNLKGVRIVSNFPDQIERDKIMQDVKVIVQLRKFEKMGLVSTSRCNTALCLGRPIVAERHEYSKPWDEIVKFVNTEQEFYNMAIATKAAWRAVHAFQLEKLKEKLPPEVCVGFAIRAIHEIRMNKKKAA